MTVAETKQLLALLDELAGAVEELLLAGLTTASRATVERLDVTFREASRMRLLRLGSTLRIANEEIGRFMGGGEGKAGAGGRSRKGKAAEAGAGPAGFSARRLAFFLGRAWLLATAMRRAVAAGDYARFETLRAPTPGKPIEKLKLVTLGVSKWVVPGTFAAFDFRMRVVEPAGAFALGDALIWSFLFGMRRDSEMPPEGHLHIEQRKHFCPLVLLEKKVISVTDCAVSDQLSATRRLSLTDSSKVEVGEVFANWRQFWQWDQKAAAARLSAYRPTPADLEVELQEEVFVRRWEPSGERVASEEGHDLQPLATDGIPLMARLEHGPSGVPLRATMMKLVAAKRRPALFGVAHYESGGAMFQPLTAVGTDGTPEYLTISPTAIKKSELVKAMKFT